MKKIFPIICTFLFLLVINGVFTYKVSADVIYSNDFTQNLNNWTDSDSAFFSLSGVTFGDSFQPYYTLNVSSLKCIQTDIKLIHAGSDFSFGFRSASDNSGAILALYSSTLQSFYFHRVFGYPQEIISNVHYALDTNYHTYEFCKNGSVYTLYIDNHFYDSADFSVDDTMQSFEIGDSNNYYFKNFFAFDTYPMMVANQPPVVNPIYDTTSNEGSTYSISDSFTDPDSTSWIGTVDYGDGTGIQPLALNPDNTFNLSHQYKDEGQYAVTVTIADNQGATGQVTAIVMINEINPTVIISAPSINPVQVGTPVTFTSTFSDPGSSDIYNAIWDWGDGSSSPGTVTQQNGLMSGSVIDSHTYANTGVYTVTLTVSDGVGGSTTQAFQYESVYNPTSQGLFSAGSKYTSPAGAYAANPSLTGDVRFGLSYKYQGTMPVGDRQFMMNFKSANLTFNATTVSSLVIANGMSTLTGTGTINGGSQAYNFLVTGSEANNTIRVQITDPSNNNAVIYDTQPGDPATTTPTTSVSGQVLTH